MAERIKSFDLGAKIRPSFSKLRRGADLAPATLELKETFALRRILLKYGQRTEEECSFVRKFLAERTTIWREPFWALLSKKEQLKVAGCVKLRMVPSDAEPHDFVAADSTSGCMIFSPLKGVAQVQCFDSSGTKLEFQEMETFGFLPVPEIMMEDAMRGVEKVKSNPRSKVYRGEREYGERRQATSEAGKIRVKIAPDGQYLSISGAEVIPMLKKVSEKRGRSHLMKSMGLELPGMGEGGGGGGGGGGEGREGREGRKKEVLMREGRYGVGSVLVDEGAAPTMVFVIVEGECRIIKSGKPRAQSQSAAGAKTAGGRSARYNLGSGQSSKVGVVLTSGFHTQVDVCQLGSLGPKALIGDIPALLGGVQPASVVAKTPLRVLQCRADRFAAHLDHNIRAKTVYVAAAKARKARMTERGAEVEHLMSLDGTPLLVDMSTNSASAGSASGGGGGEKTKAGNASSNDDDEDPAETNGGGPERPLMPHRAEAKAAENENGRRRGSANDAGGPAAEKAPPHASEGGGRRRDSKEAQRLSRSASTPSGAHSEDPPVVKGGTTAAAVESGRERLSSGTSPPRGLDAARVLATASTPQLPCFSLGSSPQLAFRGGNSNRQDDGQQAKHNGDGALLSKTSAAAASYSATKFASELSAPSSAYCRGNAARWVGGNVSTDRLQQTRRSSPMTSRHSGPPPYRSILGGTNVEGEEQGRPPGVVAATRGRASMLLASHLTPFPTITKNRSLHAVSQPIVKHSEGFADACRGEASRSGTAAWRVAREARYDGLVAPADRLSIARQIEAGFDALQGLGSDRVRVLPAE